MLNLFVRLIYTIQWNKIIKQAVFEFKLSVIEIIN